MSWTEDDQLRAILGLEVEPWQHRVLTEWSDERVRRLIATTPRQHGRGATLDRLVVDELREPAGGPFAQLFEQHRDQLDAAGVRWQP